MPPVKKERSEEDALTLRRCDLLAWQLERHKPMGWGKGAGESGKGVRGAENKTKPLGF